MSFYSTQTENNKNINEKTYIKFYYFSFFKCTIKRTQNNTSTIKRTLKSI